MLDHLIHPASLFFLWFGRWFRRPSGAFFTFEMSYVLCTAMTFSMQE
ncbi:hypothetical protein CFT9_02008 [Pseudomonas sp. CFT9]|nr:hypothetical protein CFT9_02008 [Pseudomonas sp. CFT9]